MAVMSPPTTGVTSSTTPAASSSGVFWSIKFFTAFVAIPYLIGYVLSVRNIDQVHAMLDTVLTTTTTSTAADRKKVDRPELRRTLDMMSSKDVNLCFERLLHYIHDDDSFRGVSIELHRNGDVDACGETGDDVDLLDLFNRTIGRMSHCPSTFENKYEMESFLTRALYITAAGGSCHSTESDRTPDEGLYGFCDMGPDKTPQLSDHRLLVPIEVVPQQETTDAKKYLPCHFHDRHGVRVTRMSQLAELAKKTSAAARECENTAPEGEGEGEGEENPQSCSSGNNSTTVAASLHLTAVPAGRVFMFAPAYVGQRIDLPHVTGGDPAKPVYMTVMSLKPRVFDIANFFTKEESADLVARALAETKESHRIKRSSTGASGYNTNKKRTSESGFDTDGETSIAVKRRCFDVLGFDDYIESHADGLQILRYNLTKAYNQHMDWIQGNDQLEHDYESGGVGGNRFATILLYMSDLGERDGGETVFTEAWPMYQAEQDRVSVSTALKQLRESGDGAALAQGSWEEEMVARCRTRLSISPNSARAVLFYSQHPNGQEDRSSLHGGCPVLKGTKYAANLWVWNTPRDGYPGNPKNPRFRAEAQPKVQQQQQASTQMEAITATFRNTGETESFERAELYYMDQFWAKLGHGDPVASVNTYPGHVWNVKVDGNTVMSWTIRGGDGRKHQNFDI